MLEDIKAEDVASFITAASAAKKAGKKKFSIGGKSYPVTIGKALEQRVAEMTEDDIIELNDKKKSKYLTAMKARLNKEDTGISIARKMMQITSMRHLAEIIAEMEIITPDELQSIVSEDLKIAARSLFLEDMIPLNLARWPSGQIPLDRQIELDRRAMVKIIRTKDNKFQVQRMTKGKFVNQGKPYNSLKQAEKERSREIRDLATGQSSMQFEENLKELGLKITDRKPIKKENDMYEGMTPMQRALAKVKAQPKDKVSVKKAPWDKDDVKKESIENVNEVVDFDNLGDSLPYFIDRRKGAESDWYSNINRTMKMLESDLKDRKNLHLGNARRYMDVKGHHEASLKAIADVRSKLKNVVKAFDKAFSEANAVDREIIRADKEAAKYKVRK